MLDAVYEWIRTLACYLVVITAVLEAIPGEGYKKYVRFFTGLVMILLFMTPVLKLTGTEQSFTEIYQSREYEQEKQEMEQWANYLEQADLMDFLPEEYLGGASGTQAGQAGTQNTADGSPQEGAEGTAGQEDGREDTRIRVEEIEIGE